MQPQQVAHLLLERLGKGAAIPGLDSQAAARLGTVGAELPERMARMMTAPVTFDREDAPLLHDAYYVGAWCAVAQHLGGGAALKVLEVASGDVAVVPWGLELYDGGGCSYATANLNKKLTQNFLAKTAALRTAVRVVEDDGANMAQYYAPGSFDVLALQHGVNDIVQTILCEREGMDTVNGDWWENLPQMIRISDEYHRSGRLEDTAKAGFLACMKTCADLVRPGGYLAFNSIVYQYDLDLGYPLDLYESYIPMARRWLLEAGMGLTETTPDGWDRRWWMVLRKAPN